LKDSDQGPAVLDAPVLDPATLTCARTAAPSLLGCTLVAHRHGRTRAGTIVETEAYLESDPASHSFIGLTERNRVMFGPAGNAYVYRIHRCVCFNVVTGARGHGEAVLIRALEPVWGLRAMQRARALTTTGGKPPEGFAVSNGPGKLCQAMGITPADNGAPLLVETARDGLRLLSRPHVPVVAVSGRIGISKARHEPLRFAVVGNPWVSGPRPAGGELTPR